MPREGNKTAKGTQSRGRPESIVIGQQDRESSSNESAISLSSVNKDPRLVEKVTEALAKGVPKMRGSVSFAPSSEAGLLVGARADENQSGRRVKLTPPKTRMSSPVGGRQIEDIENYNLAKRAALNILP